MPDVDGVVSNCQARLTWISLPSQSQMKVQLDLNSDSNTTALIGIGAEHVQARSNTVHCPAILSSPYNQFCTGNPVP
jgi:hypothetical protein